MLHTFQFASGRIQFQVQGNGPLIFLLHGFGGQDKDWSTCSTELARHFTVITPKLVSVYLSDSDALAFTKQAEVLGAFIAEVRVRFGRHVKSDGIDWRASTTLESKFGAEWTERERVSIAGTSYGGALAWAVAALYPNLFQHLILVNAMPSRPTAYFRDPSLNSLLKFARLPYVLPYMLQSPLGLLMVKRVEVLFQAPWSQHSPNKRFARWTARKARVVALIVSRFSKLVHGEDWDLWNQRISNIQTPVLMITGKQDPLFTHSELQKWSHVFMKRIVHEIDGSHMLTRDEPSKVARLIIQFANEMNELERASGADAARNPAGESPPQTSPLPPRRA